MKLWKRNAVVAAIVLFVCAAVYLNWSYSQEVNAGKTLGEATLVGAQTSDPLLTGQSEASPSPAVSGTSDYFSSARLNRQQARDSALALLQEAAADEKATQATIDEANAAIQTMAADTRCV